MPQKIDERAYNELIEALNTFRSSVSDSCENMSDAAQACVEQTDEGEESVKAQAKLQGSITVIERVCEAAGKLAVALQNELEEAQRIARMIDDI